jgi:signal transduction histidine kinase
VLGKTVVSKILLIFFLAAFVVSATVGCFAYFSTKHRVNNQLTEQFREEASLARTYIEESISQCYIDIQLLSFNPFLTSADATTEDKWVELVRAQYLHGLFDDVTLLDPKGIPITSTRYISIGEWSAQKVFQEALAGHGSMSDAQSSLIDPTRLVVIVAAPVFNPESQHNSEVVSVITAQINMARIWQVIDKMQVGDTGYVTVVNERSQYISYPQNENMLFESIANKDVSVKENSLFSYHERYPEDIRGDKWVEGDRRTGLLSSPISKSSPIDKGWRVLISQKSSEAYASLNQTRWVIFWGLLVAVVFFLVVGILASRWLSKPLLLLAQGTKRIACGDFSHRLTIKRSDEIGELARSYNEMASKLEQRETDREYLQLLSRSVVVWSAVSDNLSTEKFLSGLPSVVLDLFECDSVWLFGVRGQRLESQSFVSHRPEARRKIENALGQGISQLSFDTQSDINPFTRAYNSRQSIFIEGASSTEQSIVIQGLMESSKSGALAALPLVIGNECRAVLGITQTTPFQPGTREIMLALAQHSAIALENARLYEAAKRQSEEKSRLYEMAGVMSSSLELREVLDRALDGVMSLLPSPETAWAIISSFNEQTNIFTYEASRGVPNIIVENNWFMLDEEEKRKFASIFEGEVVMFQDVNLLPKEQHFSPRIAKIIEKVGMKSWLVISLTARGRFIGTLLIINNLPLLPSKEQVEALRNLANNIAVAMENAYLYAKERERTTELQSLEQLKTDFMLAISHELKTPLTSLIVSAGLLQEQLHSEDGTPINRLVTGMVRSVERLNRLVSDLLEAARLEHATVELDWKYTDIASIVKLTTTTFAPMMEDKGQQFVMTVPPDGLYAWMDLQRMEQLVNNLVSNAYKFTPVGGSIQLILKEEGKDFILEVSDTGPGISEDEQKRIFEPFYRASGMPRHTGSGLGLTITRRLTELLGGRISVRSNVGHGATFTVVIPKGVGEKGNVVVQ